MVELAAKILRDTLEEDKETDAPFTLAAPANALGARHERAFLGMSLLFHVTHFLHVAFPGSLARFQNPRSVKCAAPGARVRRRVDNAARDAAGVDANTPADRLPGRCSTRRCSSRRSGATAGSGSRRTRRASSSWTT